MGILDKLVTAINRPPEDEMEEEMIMEEEETTITKKMDIPRVVSSDEENRKSNKVMNKLAIHIIIFIGIPIRAKSKKR